jgi:hypothetical protein
MCKANSLIVCIIMGLIVFKLFYILFTAPMTGTNNATNTTVVGDSIEYTCSVTYNGSQYIQPSMYWTVVSTGDTITTAVTTNVSANSVQSVLMVTTTTNVVPSYRCYMYFPASTTTTTIVPPPWDNGTKAANNIPTCNNNYTFDAFNVLCK